MKKIYALVGALTLGLSSISWAQGLSIVSYDQLTEENSTYLHEVKAHATVQYSGTSATYEVARIFEGTQGVADSNYFCWDLCYGTGTDSTQFGGVTLNDGDRNSDFYIGWYIRANSLTASDSSVYRMYNVADPGNDYVDFIFKLNVSPTMTQVEIQQADVNVYPNPASDVVYVQVGNTESGSIRLMNLAGVTVIKKNFSNSNGKVELDVRSLPAGVYMIQAASEGQIIETQRLVISH